MADVRAALYLDFDNVFGGLLTLDPEAALRFAEDPGAWLARLTGSLTIGGTRRWLVLRCYMNPAGSVPSPTADANRTRLYFSQFRPYFTRAGFEVVDCPRLTHSKNGADIRLVVDALDALSGPATYDEFVIASGDSDMTPLLVRLRAADRRTTLLSPSDAALALVSVADRLIGSQQVLELIQGEVEPDDEADPIGVPTPADHPSELGGTGGDVADADAAYEQLRALVTQRYIEASGPLNLATLALEVRNALGRVVDDTKWFGRGGFVRSLHGLGLADMQFSQYWVWDAARHEPPPAPTAAVEVAQPEPVDRLSLMLALPRLPSDAWPPIYRVLADYAGSHHFKLTEATRWSRERLEEQGVQVGRGALGFVVQGAAFGGSPLHRQPAPDAAEIQAAFLDNVLRRAHAAGLALTPEETVVVRRWLGAPDDPAG